MFFVILLLAGASPAFTSSLLDDKRNYCAKDEFSCADGGCTKFDKICDGTVNCLDGSDEAFCSGSSILGESWMNNRVKRQASACKKTEWQCRDGSCIGFDGKCDGVVDCPDGSDETHPLCRKLTCQSNWFRCTYGACVDGTAPCNGIQDCADNSDELLPKCRNETNEARGQFKCLNGQIIPASQHCDGTVECADGSDETIRSCAARTCPSYVFQCAYGACVDQGSNCNGVQECADNSDESDELCNRTSSVTTKRPIMTSPSPQGGKCTLPSYPNHGKYSMFGNPNAIPGQNYPTANINITCDPGFSVENERSVLSCFQGFWLDDMPRCVRFCRLPKHPSVEYRCIISGGNDIEGTRQCGYIEADGIRVKPVCRSPNYHYSGILPVMNCIDGNWDHIAVCKAGGNNITIKIDDSVLIYITNHIKNTNIQINTGKENVSLSISGWNADVLYDNVSSSLNVTYGNTNANVTNDSNTSVVVTGGDTTVNHTNGSAFTTQNIHDFDVDEGDWRMGQAKVVKPNYLHYDTSNVTRKGTVSPFIYFNNET